MLSYYVASISSGHVSPFPQQSHIRCKVRQERLSLRRLPSASARLPLDPMLRPEQREGRENNGESALSLASSYRPLWHRATHEKIVARYTVLYGREAVRGLRERTENILCTLYILCTYSDWCCVCLARARARGRCSLAFARGRVTHESHDRNENVRESPPKSMINRVQVYINE